jgi:hypothetical protein
MAQLTNGVSNPLFGTIGRIVLSSRNGVPYVKGAYKSRTKKISKKELANRQKFKVAQQILQPLLHFVRIGFAGYSERSYGFIAAKSHLLKNAMEGDQDNPVINPALVKLSNGPLPLPENIVVSKFDNNTIEFSWDTNIYQSSSIYQASSFDQAMMVAYDFEKRKCHSFPHGQFRQAGSSTLKVATGYNYHLYLAFASPDRSCQSDSVYLGEMSF